MIRSKFKHFARAFSTLLGMLAFVAGSLAAQNTTGTIRGTITGTGGAPIAEAQISARNVNSGAVRNALSNDAGGYALVGLTPGTYEMTVRRIGSRRRRERVVVQIGATQSPGFSLADTGRCSSRRRYSCSDGHRNADVRSRDERHARRRSRSCRRRAATSSTSRRWRRASRSPRTASTDSFRTFSAGGRRANARQPVHRRNELQERPDAAAASPARTRAAAIRSRATRFRSTASSARTSRPSTRRRRARSSRRRRSPAATSGPATRSYGYQNKGMVAARQLPARDKSERPELQEARLQAHARGAERRRPDHQGQAALLRVVRRQLSEPREPRGHSRRFRRRAFPALDTVNLTQYNGSFTLAVPREPVLRQAERRRSTTSSNAEISCQQPPRDRHPRLRRQHRTFAGGGELSQLQQRRAGQVQLLHRAVAERSEGRLLALPPRLQPERPGGHPRRVLHLPNSDYDHRQPPSRPGLHPEALGFRNDLTLHRLRGRWASTCSRAASASTS